MMINILRGSVFILSTMRCLLEAISNRPTGKPSFFYRNCGYTIGDRRVAFDQAQFYEAKRPCKYPREPSSTRCVKGTSPTLPKKKAFIDNGGSYLRTN